MLLPKCSFRHLAARGYSNVSASGVPARSARSGTHAVRAALSLVMISLGSMRASSSASERRMSLNSK